MQYRKATRQDIAAIAQIYADIHTQEESGAVTIGWNRAIYPTEQTARLALQRGDLFVQEQDETITGAAIINQIQVDCYYGAKWQHKAPDEKVMVLHTLVIAPAAGRKGLGQDFVSFYEQYALQKGCPCLRMDTNARNTRARAMYKKLGYSEPDIVPCVFNGIEGVQLVLLEKMLTDQTQPDTANDPAY
jgi:ribosomal protein S18 acetylase RimI-like enzyme